jgi:hypothetical protein
MEGIYVPLIVLVILIVIAVGVVLVKGIDILKDFIEWGIIAFISYVTVLLVMNIGFPDFWMSVAEEWRIYVIGLFNIGFTLPLTVIMKLITRPIFKFLRRTIVIGGK